MQKISRKKLFFNPITATGREDHPGAPALFQKSFAAESSALNIYTCGACGLQSA